MTATPLLPEQVDDLIRAGRLPPDAVDLWSWATEAVVRVLGDLAVDVQPEDLAPAALQAGSVLALADRLNPGYDREDPAFEYLVAGLQTLWERLLPDFPSPETVAHRLDRAWESLLPLDGAMLDATTLDEALAAARSLLRYLVAEPDGVAARWKAVRGQLPLEDPRLFVLAVVERLGEAGRDQDRQALLRDFTQLFPDAPR